MIQKLKNIFIVGGGFGGVTAALGLAKSLKGKAQITLVDKRDYQLFTPNLYEVATAEEEFTSINQLKKSISTSLKEILSKAGVGFLKGELVEVDQVRSEIKVGIRKYSYDKLILSLGSETDYMNVVGAKEFGLPLKTLTDAFRIRNQVEFLFQSESRHNLKRPLRLLIVGGGYTAVEFTAELSNLVEILCWKYNYPREKIDILILEAASRLLGVLPEKVGVDVKQRLRDLNVRVQVNSIVAEVESGFVKLKNGERLEYDFLVWATGVKATGVNFTNPVELDVKGRIPTNGLLQMQNHENIFIIGDECCIVDEHGVSAPPTAQDAIHQAKFLTQVLPKLLQNQKPNYYTCMHHGFIIMLGGKWGVLTWGKWYFKGFVVYFLRQAADFNYFKSVLGIKKAIKYLWFGQRVFTRND